jgi:uncharacterized repeat protein (TIGR01451 family)
MNGFLRLLATCIILTTTLTLSSAQGWQNVYNQPGPDEVQGSIMTAKPVSDGILLAGYSSQATFIRKLTPQGQTLWNKLPGNVATTEHAEIFPFSDGRFLLFNYTDGFATSNNLYMFSAEGNLLWQKTYAGLGRLTASDSEIVMLQRPSVSEYNIIRLDPNGTQLSVVNHQGSAFGYVCDIEPYQGGYAVLFTSVTNRFRLVKTDANANVLSDTTYMVAPAGDPGKMHVLPDGSIYAVSTNSAIGVTIAKIAANGTLIWYSNSLFQGDAVVFEPRFTGTPDGGFAIVFDMVLSSSLELRKYNGSGQLQWSVPFAFNSAQTYANSVNTMPDGSYIISGQTDGHGLVLRTDIYENTLFNHVQGQITKDENNNCLADAGELPLNNWVVTAQKTGSNLTYYANSDVNGHYDLQLPDGEFTLTLVPAGIYWEACDPSEVLTLINSASITHNFPVTPLINCPLLEVSIGTPFLRRCFSNTYAVSWCNNGTVVAENAQLHVVVSPFFTLENFTLPLSSQNGDTLTFNLGNVAPNACGTAALTFLLSCEAELGSTHCVEAFVTPNNICANWSGAQVRVQGECIGDSLVQFRVQNIGANATSHNLKYIITEDLVVLMQGNFQLQPGEEITLNQNASGGFLRLEADQEPDFPFHSQPSVNVFGCGDINAQGAGPANLLSLDDGSPFQDIDCKTVIGSFDPNDKQGFPSGYGAEHFIRPGTDINYLIRFQNTGTDTAFTVVIRDTLSALLDPATIRVGAASHPYTWNLSGEGILTFRFENILLPDSNVNEPASHGFVQFEISHRKNIPLGSAITNSAGIYFDFNEPVITNTTLHTVQENFLTSSLLTDPTANIPFLTANPNPANDYFTIQLPHDGKGIHRIFLYDATGRPVRSSSFQGNTARMDLGQLPAGWYWLDIRDAAGNPQGRGKVMVR